MTTPQDATEALARALAHSGIHIDLRPSDTVRADPCESCAPGIAAATAALAADGWSVMRTEDVERLREAATFFAAHVQEQGCDHDMHAGSHTSCPPFLALRAALRASVTPPPRYCQCKADTELGMASGCEVCGHRDHGASGCRAALGDPS